MTSGFWSTETPSLRRTDDGRFVSYAQCGEDAVLLRVFGDQSSGCWVDVGANHPVNDSVTKNFSDLGWTGINVEPVESLHALLTEMRPRDSNVLGGVSDRDGELTFFRVDSNLGLSTFQADLAAGYRAAGESVTEVRVAITTLAAICETYLDGRTIDFMKIDAERHEYAVLAGHDFDRFPVRVLLAETGDDYDDIVELVTRRGMRFVQFDGLNCWFVGANEADELVQLISRPTHPVLDGYHPAVYVDQLEAQHTELLAMQRRLSELEAGGVVGVARRARLRFRHLRAIVAARLSQRRSAS
jgi:FkbM family methyltransferase